MSRPTDNELEHHCKEFAEMIVFPLTSNEATYTSWLQGLTQAVFNAAHSYLDNHVGDD